MQEPEAQLQATANLSPVSPSPVHTSAAQVVPALQHTVDTIDAMVAAAVAPNGIDIADHPTATAAFLGGVDGDGDDVVDDDSFDDAYAEEPAHEASTAEPQQEQLEDVNDDYAKTFDSPIEPEEVEGSEDFTHHVSSLSRESHPVSLPSDRLTSRPSNASHAASDSPSAPQGATGLNAAQPVARHQPSPSPAQQSRAASTSQPASSSFSENQDASADIQQLVADLTSHIQESPSDHNPQLDAPAAGLGSVPTSALPSASSLPPRPPLPHSASQSYVSQHHPTGTSANAAAAAAATAGPEPPMPGQPSTYAVAGAPGTTADAVASFLPPPGTGLSTPSVNAAPYPSAPPGYSNEQAQESNFQHEWEKFMNDERQYMSEAKWDRFPEGSRIFIGNLSSDKVSKRDVFELFHRFGKLAQISLKSAYGFAQYHTVEEGHRAMENLQGIEIKGRRLHLEISRAQDKKKDRARSQDRGRGRDGGRDNGRDNGREGGGRGGRRNDRHNQQARDDYRPDRNSPRRTDFHREDNFTRDRGFHDSDRGRRRSQSPGMRRNDMDTYRRRSPSPYGRSRNNSDIDLPRRYGSDVPDVQMILQPDVSREFVAYIEGRLRSKGLKIEVMFLHPRVPKEQVIQRQAAEGVHAVVELDLRAQGSGLIPVQAFDRSAGMSNVRFDQYVDLNPDTAAEVIVRAKASGAMHYAQPYAGVNGYSQPYAAQPPSQGPSYPGPQQPPNYQPQQQAFATAELASLMSQMGQVDGPTLQRLLASLQTAAPAGHAPAGVNPGPGSSNPQVDLQAILGSLSVNGTPQQPAAHGQYGAPYGGALPPAPHGGMPQAHARSGDSAAQVQNIMAQLARYRQ
jgi:nuclear polyadenylated RNA-binding protein 3